MNPQIDQSFWGYESKEEIEKLAWNYQNTFDFPEMKNICFNNKKEFYIEKIEEDKITFVKDGLPMSSEKIAPFWIREYSPEVKKLWMRPNLLEPTGKPEISQKQLAEEFQRKKDFLFSESGISFLEKKIFYDTKETIFWKKVLTWRKSISESEKRNNMIFALSFIVLACHTSEYSFAIFLLLISVHGISKLKIKNTKNLITEIAIQKNT